MADEPRQFPRLRPDVAVMPREGDDAFPAVLVDPKLDQRVRLDPLGASVARQLDRPRTAEELVGLLDDTVPPEDRAAERVSETVAGLRRLFVLADSRAAKAIEERERAEAWMDRPTGEIPLHHARGARFDCTACGGCCGGHNIGPVDDHVQMRMRTDEGREFLAEHGIPDPPYWSGAEVSGKKGAAEIMRSRGGWCVFLDQENLCRIHGAFGASAKPSVCQLFPFTFVLRPDGVAVSLQMECRDVLEGAKTGRPFSEQEDELRYLLRLPQQIARVRPAIPIDGMATLAYEDYARLRDAMVEAFSPADAAAREALTTDPIRALAQLRRMVDERGRPAAEGHPADVTRLSGPGELRDALHETVQALGGQLVQVRRALADEDAERVVRTTSLDRVLGGLTQLVPHLERVMRPPRDPEARELFRMLVVNALMGEEVGSARNLRHGLTTLALRWVLARAIAIDRAHDVKRPEPTVQEHLDGLVTASFALRSPRTLMVPQKLATPLSLLFYDHLEDIAAYAAELAVPDDRIEVYLS